MYKRQGFDGALADLPRGEVEHFIRNVIDFVSEAEDKVWLKKTVGALDGFGCLRLLTDFSSFDIRIELALNGKPLAQLSPGQRGLVLLLFILEADLSGNVLLIDQPEDNLDNDAIRRLLIPALDRARLKRQIIVVTHNANIGVLGDPDQVICCTFDGQKFSVRAGSITEDGMQSELLRVLEGAEEAFRDRASRYGIAI